MTAPSSAVVPESTGRRIAAALEAALAAQREVMRLWGDQLEQMLSMLVFMVPVQDEADDSAGFWNQACYSAIDLFSLYRTMLLRSPEALPVALPAGSSAGSGQLQHLRLTYTVAAFALRGLRAVQVLLEMRSWHTRGQRRALRTCLRIELVKLALKAWLRTRMPFAFYVDEDALGEVLGEAEPPRLGAPVDPSEAARQEVRRLSGEAFVGRRSGKTFRALPLQHNLCEDASPPSGLLLAAELVYHCRPLLHLQLLYRRGRKSWAAWLVALLLDRLSVGLLTAGLQPRRGSRAAALELAELQRRRNQTWWALARSPMFEKVLQKPCEALDRVLKRIPIVNIFNVVEVALALQPFYFSTAAT